MDPNAAFPDAQKQPSDEALAAILGSCHRDVARTLALVQAAVPRTTTEWRFSDRCGWYQLWCRGERRLVYLVPQRGEFRLALILGDKALASLDAVPLGPRIHALCRDAVRYPEGTSFKVDSCTLAPEIVAALVTAKAAH